MSAPDPTGNSCRGSRTNELESLAPLQYLKLLSEDFFGDAPELLKLTQNTVPGLRYRLNESNKYQ
ncbi:MAG: hypothetical protein ACK5RO_03780 [Pseudobdellovibrionaceae bacterium]